MNEQKQQNFNESQKCITINSATSEYTTEELCAFGIVCAIVAPIMPPEKRCVLQTNDGGMCLIYLEEKHHTLCSFCLRGDNKIFLTHNFKSNYNRKDNKSIAKIQALDYDPDMTDESKNISNLSNAIYKFARQLRAAVKGYIAN